MLYALAGRASYLNPIYNDVRLEYEEKSVDFRYGGNDSKRRD